MVTNRDIYPGACEQSAKHVGKTATQLAQDLGQVSHYHIILPYMVPLLCPEWCQVINHIATTTN